MRLNNKAMTLIEILVCFTLVGIISTMMLSTVMNYRTRQEMESVSLEVIKYKNTITKMVQDDIAKKHLKSVGKIETSENSNYYIWSVTLNFDLPEPLSKELEVYQSKGTSAIRDKIVYTDNKGSAGKKVTYTLPDFGSYHPTADTQLMNLRFGVGFEDAPTEHTKVNINRHHDDESVFIADIPIFYHELGAKYHILIEAPINQ